MRLKRTVEVNKKEKRNTDIFQIYDKTFNKEKKVQKTVFLRDINYSRMNTGN